MEHNQKHQGTFENEGIYMQPPVQKNAAYFRKRARAALKGMWAIAVLVCFLASLLGGISSGFESPEFEYKITVSENGTIVIKGGDDFSGEDSDDYGRPIRNMDDLREVINETVEKLSPWTFLIAVMSVLAILSGFAYSIFLGGPVAVGHDRFQLELIDGKKPTVGTLFSSFGNGYLKTAGLRALSALISFVCSLPMLVAALLGALPLSNVIVQLITTHDTPDVSALLAATLVFAAALFVGAVITVILQIFVGYRFSFATMIMAEYPEISPVDALRASSNLMRGNIWRYFCLQFSFIGWILLASLVSLGIGMLWINPYMNAARAAFYDDLANRNASKDVEFPSVNFEDYDPNVAQW